VAQAGLNLAEKAGMAGAHYLMKRDESGDRRTHLSQQRDNASLVRASI
jgi:hypothetical protein